MRALGFNVANGILKFAVLEGTIDKPLFSEREKLEYRPQAVLSHRMAWFQDQFDVLIDRLRPDAVAYRMHMGRAMTQEQIGTYHYPWGILLLVCGRQNVAAAEFTGASLTAKRFGLAKGEKPMAVIDAVIGTHPPHWDDAQRYAACVAWGSLPKA
jgi:Holliday junction resolvasome RuvABC endonuclease subunit